MKKLQLLTYFVLLLIISGCSNSEIPFSEKASESYEENVRSHAITQEEAIHIANVVLNRKPHRSESESTPSIEYVLSETKSRSSHALSDTLAYVVNFPNNEGFVIVSSDNRVYPVLAYSDNGHFSFDNENVKENFIVNIESYIENADDNSKFEVTSEDFDECYEVFPIINISLGQREPWNKYVVKENPDCPAGCVAVATALVISHSRIQLSYHGVKYHTGSIITAIKKGKAADSSPNKLPNKSPKRIAGGHPTDWPTYTYDQAVDSMAKMLYWIGKDVDMIYKPSSSSAVSSKALKLCNTLGLTTFTEFADYNLMEIVDYLENNHMVYLRGNDIDTNKGHAWVVDGATYCVDPNDTSIRTRAFIHCDWGWYGNANGYYSGEVFEASVYRYKPSKYFAVKRDATLKNHIYTKFDD